MPAEYSSVTPCSIHVPLFKNETGDQDIATWPPAVQTIMARELDRFAKRNPHLDIGETSSSLDPVRQICVIEFFPQLAEAAP